MFRLLHFNYTSACIPQAISPALPSMPSLFMPHLLYSPLYHECHPSLCLMILHIAQAQVRAPTTDNDLDDLGLPAVPNTPPGGDGGGASDVDDDFDDLAARFQNLKK